MKTNLPFRFLYKLFCSVLFFAYLPQISSNKAALDEVVAIWIGNLKSGIDQFEEEPEATLDLILKFAEEEGKWRREKNYHVSVGGVIFKRSFSKHQREIIRLLGALYKLGLLEIPEIEQRRIEYSRSAPARRRRASYNYDYEYDYDYGYGNRTSRRYQTSRQRRQPSQLSSVQAIKIKMIKKRLSQKAKEKSQSLQRGAASNPKIGSMSKDSKHYKNEIQTEGEHKISVISICFSCLVLGIAIGLIIPQLLKS